MVDKIALIIGNSKYNGSDYLANPINDAKEIGKTLTRLGFDCTVLYDLSRDDMISEIDLYISRLEKSKNTISLFYFSGHGIQVYDQNFLVPIDFQIEDKVTNRLIKVQPIVDRMSEHSDIRLIMLDACRNNPDAQKVEQAEGLLDITNTRSMYVGGKEVKISGLAKMKSDRNTFIAFAAAAGDFAYDGSGNLSPFTEALVRNIESVDLPLSNLMIRVRKEVFAITQNKQKTWDHSSLEAPFYFNPGSLILYTGNIMAIIGLAISFCIYSLVLGSHDSSAIQIALTSLLPISALGVLLYGMQSVYSRLRGNIEYKDERRWTIQDHITLSAQKGIIGGFLGAILGSFWISVPYYYEWQKEYQYFTNVEKPASLGFITTEIAIATTFVASLLGTLCIMFTRLTFQYKKTSLVSTRTWFRTLLGSSAGGTISGIIAAPFLMAYFGRLSRPPVTPEFLLPGAVFGSSIIIFSIVNFDYESLSLRRIVKSGAASVAALIGGAIASIVVFGPLYLLGIVQKVTESLENNFHHFPTMLAGSIAYGTPVGFVLGIVIGLAIVFTEKWSSKPIV
ncbi:caspase family protein [Methylorubrum sp. SB2]|uniref:caspase family protein n=1 Tax=Methylorubrum subtropicum TaxID=3138812 RepID=UPI00313EB368